MLTPEQKLENKRKSGLKYYYKNRDAKMAYQKEYDAKNSKIISEKQKEKYQKNKKQFQEYYIKNKEHRLNYAKDYFQKNKDKIYEKRRIKKLLSQSSTADKMGYHSHVATVLPVVEAPNAPETSQQDDAVRAFSSILTTRRIIKGGLL